MTKLQLTPTMEGNPPTSPLYLWLNCEGWERFGPFEWLSFNDDAGVIADSTGSVIARRRNHGGWFVNRPGLRDMRFCDPMITTSDVHPHPVNGAHPHCSPEP